MHSLMRHTATVYRPALATRTAQEVAGYAVAYRAVPCFAQPASTAMIAAHAQRGQEVTHAVYTTDVEARFKLHDLLEITDPTGRTRELHVVAVKDALLSGLYQELTCYEYPDGAQRRLNREAYP